jgi:hypothetical protein
MPTHVPTANIAVNARPPDGATIAKCALTAQLKKNFTAASAENAITTTPLAPVAATHAKTARTSGAQPAVCVWFAQSMKSCTAGNAVPAMKIIRLA